MVVCLFKFVLCARSRRRTKPERPTVETNRYRRDPQPPPLPLRPRVDSVDGVGYGDGVYRIPVADDYLNPINDDGYVTITDNGEYLMPDTYDQYLRLDTDASRNHQYLSIVPDRNSNIPGARATRDDHDYLHMLTDDDRQSYLHPGEFQ